MAEPMAEVRTGPPVPSPRPVDGGGAAGAPEELLLIGCGILAGEVRAVLDQRGVRASTCFLPPALHTDPDRLEQVLVGALDRRTDRPRVVFYGSCHPRMDALLDAARTRRTAGQSCVEILLGTELYTEHLRAGAYFLLERWAQSWDLPGHPGTGTRPEPDLLREVLQVGHRYVLGVRTPLSGDFTGPAEAVATRIGLPLRWLDVGLTELARRLDETLDPR